MCSNWAQQLIRNYPQRHSKAAAALLQLWLVQQANQTNEECMGCHVSFCYSVCAFCPGLHVSQMNVVTWLTELIDQLYKLMYCKWTATYAHTKCHSQIT